MSRFCHYNAPERCEMLAIKYFADELGDDKYYDDLTDEQKSEICRFCSEDLVAEAEYKMEQEKYKSVHGSYMSPEEESKI